MSSQARKANTGLDLSGKTAVIAGGSQGIGAGVAIRFAQAGANIIIVGRSKERLERVISDASKVAKSTGQKLDYVSTDLSLVSGVKSAAKELENKSNGKVDYLVQTQGGTPNGLQEATSEGIESHFAVQVLSRFLLAYLLASSGVLRDTGISIMAHGGKETSFDFETIGVVDKVSGRFSLMGQQIRSDAIITDTYTKSLQSKLPQLNFFHVSPGLVQTDVMVNQGVPFPMPELMTYIVFPIAARTIGNSVASYADIPVFLAANEERKGMVEKDGYFLDNKNKRVTPSPSARDEGNQMAVFEKLVGYLET